MDDNDSKNKIIIDKLLTKSRQMKQAKQTERKAKRKAKLKATSQIFYHNNCHRIKERKKFKYANDPMPKRAATKEAYKMKKKGITNATELGSVVSLADKFDLSVEIEKSVKIAKQIDQQSIVKGDGVNTRYRARVCVICDRFIIGTAQLCHITPDKIKDHKTQLSIASYEEYYGTSLHPQLIKQYKVKDLPGFLLSPRARFEGGEFDACSNCTNSLRSCSKDRLSPPKHAIANGFVIGHIPEVIETIDSNGLKEPFNINEEDLTDILCSFLSPVRAYGYVFAYVGGAHRSLRGHYTFYEVNLEHVGGVMNYFHKTGANPHIYCVLCGRMTPKQKELAKMRATLDTNIALKVMNWLITESGHKGYEGITPPAKCPEPIVIEEEATPQNTDDEMNPEIEHKFDGASFHFSSGNNPDEETGVYGSSTNFISAMLERTMPTLLVQGGNYANYKELNLEDIAVLQFPFGLGGPKMSRRNRISPTECYKHYCNLSLRQFMRGDFLLLLGHMNDRYLSYQTAMIKCRSSSSGTTLAEKVSLLGIDELNQAALLTDSGQRVNGRAGDFLRAVKTSCRHIGYSAEAAGYHRRQHFAFDDYFGNSAIFLTTTPCDECTFRIRLLVEPEKEHALPDLHDPAEKDDSYINHCFADFTVRQKQRKSYPGACSLVYQHLMQIVIESLLGWDPKTKTGRKGVLGRVLAWARTDEEQGRKTLHGHWQIWIDCFNECREALYNINATERESARKAFLEFVDQVISANYGPNEFTVTHNCSSNQDGKASQNQKKASEVFQEKPDKQVLRDARHEDQCLNVQGKIMECMECDEEISTVDLVNMALEGWADFATSEIANTNNRAYLNHWLDIAAYRYPFDFGDGGFPTPPLNSASWIANKSIRAALLHHRFDEHDHNHRPTCFKKGCECRVPLPMPAWHTTYIHDSVAIRNDGSDYNIPSYSCCFSEDDKSINNVIWHYLDGSTKEKSQYMVVPKRHLGSQFMNQHNVAISEVLACNTNVAIGDPSFTYYTTLYKSKNTQAEERCMCQRINGFVGQRIWRHIHASHQTNSDETNDDTQTHQQDPDYIEGLGRMLTGINAALSRDVVSSTMSHLLICQNGSRFVYSHDFKNLLITQLEDALDGKDVHFVIRRNKGQNGTIVQWADSSCDDYIHRPRELEDFCIYHMIMKYEKKFNSYDQMRDQSDRILATTRFEFSDTHPGKAFSFIQELKHMVIPKISMKTGKLCNIELLEILNPSPSHHVSELRESYAKYALMLFYPFRSIDDLQYEGCYWDKFVLVGGIDPTLIVPGGLWKRGREILQNIQNRETVEKKMSRPQDPLKFMGTKHPEKTGDRKDKDIDKEDKFDYDIDDWDFGEDGKIDDTMYESIAHEQCRSHASLISRGNIRESTLVSATLTSSTLFSKPDERTNDANHNDVNNSNNNNNNDISPSPPKDFATLLCFIEGSLVGIRDEKCDDMDDISVSSRTLPINSPTRIPTMRDIADGSSNKLDKKQYIAYQVICTTFLLGLVHEGCDGNTSVGKYLSALSHDHHTCTQRFDLIKNLKKRGARDQLVMLLSGPAGCGKSTSLELAQQFCHNFCMAVAVAFNDLTFYFTSTTGSSAALFGGMTIHSAAHLNKSKILEAYREEWKDVRILIIDEISFFKVSDMQKLDKKLKKLTGVNNLPYGGVSIVFSGDFHQLQPICKSDDILYSCSPGATAWENTINCAIFLENSHRFKDDPVYGDIMRRMRNGEDTKEDRELINTRVLGAVNGPELPDNANTCYACPTNKERNGITAGVFKNLILATHPPVGSSEMPPDHTLMIEASMRRKRKSLSRAFHDIATTTLGDDDIKVSELSSNGAKIDPVLRCYPGSIHMCISNKDLKKGRGNGTQCRCVRVKLNRGAKVQWKNWEGRKVNSVSVDDIKWVMFEHWPNPPKNVPARFKLKPTTYTAIIQWPIAPDCGNLKVKLGNVRVTQIPVNSNIATTGHKLQGMSKDTLIVNSWSYGFSNWIYVVLSRVRTLSGLYLCKPLDLNRQFNVPEKLVSLEARMKRLESHFLSTLDNNLHL